jgi:hypothetical protein
VQGQMEDLQGNPQRRPQHLASQGMQCIEGRPAGRPFFFREGEARALVFSRQCPDWRCRSQNFWAMVSGGKRLMSWTTFDSLNFPQLFAIVAVGNVCFWHFSDIPSAPMNVRYRG